MDYENGFSTYFISSCNAANILPLYTLIFTVELNSHGRQQQ